MPASNGEDNFVYDCVPVRFGWGEQLEVVGQGKARIGPIDEIRRGLHDVGALQVLSELWDSAFESGRLAALDELQDRFCVCMK